MHSRTHRLEFAAVAALCLSIFVSEATTADETKQGGRRHGSFNNLSGEPSLLPAEAFRLEVFDPDLFLATCIDPVDAANGDVSQPPCRELLGGFDHIAAGVGLRHSGFGTIVLRGAPFGAALVAARLHWSVIAAEQIATGSEGLSMEISFQGHRVTGERVGAVSELCWGTPDYSVHYSADITRYIPDGINGDYQVSGIPSSVTNGREPMQDLENPDRPWAQGISAIAIYDHPQATGRRTYLHQGAALLIDGQSLDLELSPPLPANDPTVIRHTRIGGDGQTWDGEPLLPYATFIGNDPQNTTDIQIRGPGSAFDPSSDWQGQDGAPVPGLWDTQSDELWQPFLGPQLDSYTVRWFAVREASNESPAGNPSTIVLKAEVPPPDPETLTYDCVQIGAVAMTTTR